MLSKRYPIAFLVPWRPRGGEISVQRLVSHRISTVLVWGHYIVRKILRPSSSAQKWNYRPYCGRNKALSKTECGRSGNTIKMVCIKGHTCCLHTVSRSSSFVSALGCSDHAPRCSDQPPGGARAAAASWAPRQGNIPTRAHNQHRGYTFLWTQKIPFALVSAVLLLDQGAV